MGNWYKVKVYMCHGSNHKRRSESTAYIFADSFQDVLNRYRIMPGVRRSIQKSAPMPDIDLLSKEDSTSLEQKIVDEDRISLTKAKRKWYYDFPNFKIPDSQLF